MVVHISPLPLYTCPSDINAYEGLLYTLYTGINTSSQYAEKRVRNIYFES